MKHPPGALAVLMLASITFASGCSGDEHPLLESRYKDSMQLAPAEVRPGATFKTTFAKDQVEVLVMSKRVGETWSEAFLLRDDGRTPTWTAIGDVPFRVDTFSSGSRTMTAMAPPDAAKGTYKLCALNGDACALLEVTD